MTAEPLRNFGTKNRKPTRDKRLKQEKYIRVSISIPEKPFKTIEERRGSTKRSPFICNIIAKSLGLKD